MNPRQFEAGQVVDGFRLVEPLQPGGMANFWRVTRDGSDLPMLMKIPFLTPGEDPLIIIGYEVEQMILPRPNDWRGQPHGWRHETIEPAPGQPLVRRFELNKKVATQATSAWATAEFKSCFLDRAPVWSAHVRIFAGFIHCRRRLALAQF